MQIVDGPIEFPSDWLIQAITNRIFAPLFIFSDEEDVTVGWIDSHFMLKRLRMELVLDDSLQMYEIYAPAQNEADAMELERLFDRIACL